jgi:hypothetical protein
LDFLFLAGALRFFPALDRAIAIACFFGLPDAISVLMFSDITFFDFPFFNGTILPSQSKDLQQMHSL